MTSNILSSLPLLFVCFHLYISIHRMPSNLLCLSNSIPFCSPNSLCYQLRTPLTRRTNNGLNLFSNSNLNLFPINSFYYLWPLIISFFFTIFSSLFSFIIIHPSSFNPSYYLLINLLLSHTNLSLFAIYPQIYLQYLSLLYSLLNSIQYIQKEDYLHSILTLFPRPYLPSDSINNKDCICSFLSLYHDRYSTNESLLFFLFLFDTFINFKLSLYYPQRKVHSLYYFCSSRSWIYFCIECINLFVYPLLEWWILFQYYIIVLIYLDEISFFFYFYCILLLSFLIV